MNDMAEATGGHAFVDTNGLAQAVASAIENGSNFYTLAYSPSNPAHDGEFRKIKVQLERHGLNLAYRHGSYADDPDKKTPFGDAAVTSAASTRQNVMHVAMMHGVPAPTQILMKVGVVPITPADQLEEKPAPGNSVVANIHGPYRRYSVNYAIEPDNIAFFRNPDGKLTADFTHSIFFHQEISAPFKSIRVEGIYYPVTYAGHFQSSDPLLNRIWETGAYNANLCMQDGIWDAIKRDRGRWAGDLEVVGRVISTVFDDRRLIQKTLRLLDETAPAQPLPSTASPTTPLNGSLDSAISISVPPTRTFSPRSATTSSASSLVWTPPSMSTVSSPTPNRHGSSPTGLGDNANSTKSVQPHEHHRDAYCNRTKTAFAKQS